MKLRRLISIPLGIGLALGIGFACAQVINKAMQLSQDATGAFGVDTNNGVYFPGHVLNTGNSNPTPSISGTGTPTVSGTDVAGVMTMGTSGTTAIMLFGRAYLSVPNCVVSWQNLAGNTSPIAYTPNTTGIQLSQGATSANKINYLCTGPS